MKQKELAIYQAKNGAIKLRADAKAETLWATQKQIAEVFSVDRTVISRHIRNIFKDGELSEDQVCAKFAHTTQHGSMKGKTQTREMTTYNLDMMISVGYRVNSKTATNFRKWATKTLRTYIADGFVVDKTRIKKHHDKFLAAVEDIKALLPADDRVNATDALELTQLFADTWLSLDAYDRDALPAKGASKKATKITAEELTTAITSLKAELLEKKEATELFAQERNANSVEGILGNVFQEVFGTVMYPTLEEKAAHLLYFMVKNHPFTDGNKRSGAFAFIWFLARSGMQFQKSITPQALTALTLLVAESAPKDKDRIIGLVILLLKK